ncbi:tumor necrosis factor ligand superfamily member 14 isoform X2 [Hemicordylus capensis]|uniref:tumor necrosis factor ligand superfamily member 14 isoform X2 n=1 Tax=Hemicordylus capensis TaxID=884348 RepID=UPI002302996F|nr:tumor necrosis factor ligand superfamily member 14 isoform X2 [Hemicordylus capensis]
MAAKSGASGGGQDGGRSQSASEKPAKKLDETQGDKELLNPCGENAEATHEKFVQDHKPAPEKPAAHLTGASFTASGNSTLQWEHTLGLAFLQDMGYKGGSLICNKPGHYYIYSKLYLGNSGCPHNEQKNMWVVHSIYKRTPRYPEDRPLLINNILYCNSKDSTFWWHNSFLAGVVQLEENEEIYIKVSERQLVRIKDEFKSYFGAFMI